MDAVCEKCGARKGERDARCERCEPCWEALLDGRWIGPMTRDELARVLKAHAAGRDALVWRSGVETWSSACEIPEIAEALGIQGSTPPRRPTPPSPLLRAVAERVERESASELASTSGRIDIGALLPAMQERSPAPAAYVPPPPPPARVARPSPAAPPPAAASPAVPSRVVPSPRLEPAPFPARPAPRPRLHSLAVGALIGGGVVAAITIAPAITARLLAPTVAPPGPEAGRVEHAVVDVVVPGSLAPAPGPRVIEPTPEPDTRVAPVPEPVAATPAPAPAAALAAAPPAPPAPRAASRPTPVDTGGRLAAAEAATSDTGASADAPSDAPDAPEASTPAPRVAAAEEGSPSGAGDTELDDAPPAGPALAETAPSGTSPAEAAPGETAPAATTSDTEPPSIDTLLAAAVTPEPEPAAERAPATPAPADDGVPEIPSRDDVERALARAHTTIQACGAEGHGLANVRITASGATGRVTSALVEGPLAGTAAGSCVARAVRRIELPRFRRDTFTLQVPFRI